MFVNQYKNFIVQDLVVATTPAGPLVQTVNFADVRIHGLELSADAPLVSRVGVVTLSASGAFTRGTITEATDPRTGASLADTPSDDITPVKVVLLRPLHRAQGAGGGPSTACGRRAT